MVLLVWAKRCCTLSTWLTSQKMSNEQSDCARAPRCAQRSIIYAITEANGNEELDTALMNSFLHTFAEHSGAVGSFGGNRACNIHIRASFHGHWRGEERKDKAPHNHYLLWNISAQASNADNVCVTLYRGEQSARWPPTTCLYNSWLVAILHTCRILLFWGNLINQYMCWKVSPSSLQYVAHYVDVICIVYSISAVQCYEVIYIGGGYLCAIIGHAILICCCTCITMGNRVFLQWQRGWAHVAGQNGHQFVAHANIRRSLRHIMSILRYYYIAQQQVNVTSPYGCHYCFEPYDVYRETCTRCLKCCSETHDIIVLTMQPTCPWSRLQPTLLPVLHKDEDLHRTHTRWQMPPASPITRQLSTFLHERHQQSIQVRRSTPALWTRNTPQAHHENAGISHLSRPTYSLPNNSQVHLQPYVQHTENWAHECTS